MKLKKCSSCKTYTQKATCPNCKEKTKDAHHKYLKLKSAEQSLS
ncbi:MAG: ribosome biogenesis protein [Nanoarchaeota archaeon]|nr:ribosome biogenesis protein [Nanoarchaeota archaeon]